MRVFFVPAAPPLTPILVTEIDIQLVPFLSLIKEVYRQGRHDHG